MVFVSKLPARIPKKIMLLPSVKVEQAKQKTFLMEFKQEEYRQIDRYGSKG